MIVNRDKITEIESFILSCGTHMLQKQSIENTRRRGINIIRECRELIQRCDECDWKIMWNSKNTCDEYDKGSRSRSGVQNNYEK